MIQTHRDTCGVNDHRNFLVCFLIFCSYYAIPLLIIIICYTKLAIHVIRSNRLINSQKVKVKKKHCSKEMTEVFLLEWQFKWIRRKKRTCDQNGKKI